MDRRITKALFPVAGLGTRFLPATKSIPKEIMTLVDRPLVQYAIDEAREAGIEKFIFVTSRGKGALEDYFDHAPELEQELLGKGRDALLGELRRTNMDSGAIAYVRQHRPLGLGHAVWCARHLIAPDETFAVILPDDVIAADRPCLLQMLEVHRETGGSMVAAMEVPPEKTPAYGVLDVREETGRTISVKGMIEKPETGKNPSNFAVIGRYILSPRILDHLNAARPVAGVEMQLTNAIATEIERGGDVFGYRFRGQRFDCGSKAGFLQATVAFGLSRPDLREEFSDFLARMVGKPGVA